MNSENPQRRLAAIMVTDVVGYSRLMAQDEAGTLQAMQASQFALLNPLIGQHRGRIVKHLGDGLLVEFQSVVDAVHCAIEIQRRALSHNKDIAEDKQIRYRIGINLGDILIDGDDIFGDGVNIAARLQAMAVPDAVAISGSVYSQIEGALDYNFTDLGAHQLKNISKAVRVYQFSPDPATKKVEVAFRPFVDPPIKESPVAAGGCLCGNIRYEVSGKALGSMLCHCSMCQRYSGAPILEGTTFRAEDFQLLQGEPKVYRSSKIAERGFCGDCGSPIFYRGIIGYWRDWIVVTTGSFDEPRQFPPTYHLGIESSLPWLKVLDDLPRTRCHDSPSLVEAYGMVGEEVP